MSDTTHRISCVHMNISVNISLRAFLVKQCLGLLYALPSGSTTLSACASLRPRQQEYQIYMYNVSPTSLFGALPSRVDIAKLPPLPLDTEAQFQRTTR